MAWSFAWSWTFEFYPGFEFDLCISAIAMCLFPGHGQGNGECNMQYLTNPFPSSWGLSAFGRISLLFSFMNLQYGSIRLFNTGQVRPWSSRRSRHEYRQHILGLFSRRRSVFSCQSIGAELEGMEEVSTGDILCRYDLGGLVQQYGPWMFGLGVSTAVHRSKVSLCYPSYHSVHFYWLQYSFGFYFSVGASLPSPTYNHLTKFSSVLGHSSPIPSSDHS